ncbi:putative ribosome-recycling factor, mitochondrial [Calycina marina]|uniref:Ribosome-recycling factor, mitochondrial n=1 Tax=Calycina marina TaxID=1763456 RepID=A0A9P8CHQ3_9HELO|nr:putative ribosome-recycling factor, mitochondrial [Calycina marina]
MSLPCKEKPSKSRPSSAEESTESDDPFDFSTLSAGIDKSLEKLSVNLSKLRTGGRFNIEILEDVRVQLDKDVKGTERLGDLAQVLPKGGRSVMVLVGEKDHVKPIISAIQGSRDLNFQPQTDAHNALQLNIPIPPPTKESRDQALAAASKMGGVADLGVKSARAAMQKRLRAMELQKVVRPDDLKKAHKEMEKLVEKGHADAKKVTEAARKGMEQQ